MSALELRLKNGIAICSTVGSGANPTSWPICSAMTLLNNSVIEIIGTIGEFRPLLLNCGDKDVERFLYLQNAGQVAIAEKTSEKFRELSLALTVLIEGGSGVGKTIAALALSAATGRRVFFVRIDDSIDETHADEVVDVGEVVARARSSSGRRSSSAWAGRSRWPGSARPAAARRCR